MDHRVRVAEAFAKRVANGYLSENRIADRIHRQQAFGVDGTSAGTGTYTQRVERRKRIRPKLNASPDFANLRACSSTLTRNPCRVIASAAASPPMLSPATMTGCSLRDVFMWPL